MYQIKNKGLTEANSETFHTVPKELMGKKFILVLCLEYIWFVLIFYFMNIQENLKYFKMTSDFH